MSWQGRRTREAQEAQEIGLLVPLVLLVVVLFLTGICKSYPGWGRFGGSEQRRRWEHSRLRA